MKHCRYRWAAEGEAHEIAEPQSGGQFEATQDVEFMIGRARRLLLRTAAAAMPLLRPDAAFGAGLQPLDVFGVLPE